MWWVIGNASKARSSAQLVAGTCEEGRVAGQRRRVTGDVGDRPGLQSRNLGDDVAPRTRPGWVEHDQVGAQRQQGVPAQLA